MRPPLSACGGILTRPGERVQRRRPPPSLRFHGSTPAKNSTRIPLLSRTLIDLRFVYVASERPASVQLGVGARFALEKELCSKLHETRRSGADNIAKR